jgi:acetyl esterase/lipase
VQPTDPWLGSVGIRVFANFWRGDLDISDPTVSPLNGDPAGLGPIVLFSGTRDILNPDAHLLLDKLTEAHVIVEFFEGVNEVHVYPLLPTKTGRQARDTIVGNIRAVLAHSCNPQTVDEP